MSRNEPLTAGQAWKAKLLSSSEGRYIEGLDLREAERWRPPFLAALRNSGNVRVACELASVDRRTVYKHKRLDPAFGEQWDEAKAESIELLEEAAYNRAMTTSDDLLKFLLEAHAPERYGRRARVELTGAGGGPIALSSPAQRTTRMTELLERGASAGLLTDGNNDDSTDADD